MFFCLFFINVPTMFWDNKICCHTHPLSTHTSPHVPEQKKIKIKNENFKNRKKIAKIIIISSPPLLPALCTGRPDSQTNQKNNPKTSSVHNVFSRVVKTNGGHSLTYSSSFSLSSFLIATAVCLFTLCPRLSSAFLEMEQKALAAQGYKKRK